MLELWVNKINDPAIGALMAKVEQGVDEEITRSNPYSIDTIIEVRLKDGRILKQASTYEKEVISLGTKHLRPLSRADVHNKFRNVASMVIRKDVAESIIDAVERVEECQDVGAIFSKGCTT